MNINNNNNSQIDCMGMFDGKALTALSSGHVPDMLIALEQMYQDAFLYGLPCGIIDGKPGDYNILSFEERSDINLLYTSIISLFKIVGKYDFSIWIAEEQILLSEGDVSAINEIFGGLYESYPDIGRFVDYLKEMTMMTVLYKLIVKKERPTSETGDLYFNANCIADIISGYSVREYNNINKKRK